MKLGLAVVYLVRGDSEALLRIHLERIRRHTTVPHVIHGAPLRLPAAFHRRLEGAGVRLHSLTPPSGALSHVEHSALLTELLNHAVADGCTHVGTLHVDSFPVADDWVETIAARLGPGAPVAAVLEEMEGDTMARPNLAGMIALADFWREARPWLTPSAEREQTAEWKAFLHRHRQHVTHSGVGLGYCLEQAGKTWLPLRRTNGRRRHPVLGGVYDDRIFHLGAATRPQSFFTDGQTAVESGAMRRRRRWAGWARQVLPKPIRRILSPLRPIGQFYDQRPRLQNETISAEIRAELFADPDHFLAAAMLDRE
ncbi:MAG: hypothetical protein DVB31_08610 [Verrucomicrobia bacterium]|nr:MAG: hypothetical protein DVB31_08610 [Verrucomicrobiota bacterium]